MISRRSFLALGSALAASSFAAPKPRRILVASQWHTVNIGDIAHGPGLVRLIQRHLPEVEISLWPARALTQEIRAMMVRAFPKLAFAEGSVDAEGKPSTPEFAAELARCDTMLLASGGYHPTPVRSWRRFTRKPYGVFGNGFDYLAFPKTLPAESAEELNGAQFVYGRETVSVGHLKRLGVTAPGLSFCPDSTFGFDLHDEKRAGDFLARSGLEAGKFICVIPMLRYTPHWKLYGLKPTEKDLRGEKTNAEFKEQDHVAVRELIITWVRKTGLKVLACPEMTYQVELSKELLIDPLPDDVKRSVVWRDTFWMPDEAAAVYAKASAVISVECHSPILALVAGTPAIHVRLPSETAKGQMFRDVGVGEWIHEVADLTGPQLAAQVLAIQADPAAARAKVTAAMNRVNAIYREVFDRVAAGLQAN